MVKLDKINSTNILALVIKGNNTVEIQDVLAGEVWLCSGQSNMEMGIGGARDANKETSSAKYPRIRQFKVEHNSQSVPRENCSGKWIVCSPRTARKFSAAAYFFGHEIHQRINTPLGLINSSWGGTLVEAWMSLEALAKIDEFKTISGFLAKSDRQPWDEKAANALYEKKMVEWKISAEKARANKKKIPRRPRKSIPARLNKNVPANLFNGMINPLIPYAIRGAIWYQGESNAFVSHAKLYGLQLAALIRDWRAHWGYDFPFAWVQLPEFNPNNYIGLRNWPVICEQMLKTLSIPHTGMAVGLGLGEADNIHPKDKQGLGKRLALWALAGVYGHKDITWNGPLLEDVKIKNGDGEIILSFKHTDGGPWQLDAPVKTVTDNIIKYL